MGRLWSLVWRNYIDDGWTVTKVINWRTAIVENHYGKRQRITPCPLKTCRAKRKNKRCQQP